MTGQKAGHMQYEIKCHHHHAVRSSYSINAFERHEVCQAHLTPQAQASSSTCQQCVRISSTSLPDTKSALWPRLM
jgi:hypothetical protein